MCETSVLTKCVLTVQVGKSLLIKCLIKHYTRQSLSEVRGPITIVAGKQRRLTFVECPQVLPPSFSVISGYATKTGCIVT